MDFNSSLLPNEQVVWSATIEKQRHDAALRPAPPIREMSKPRMNSPRDECAGEFRVAVDERVIRSLRTKWGINP